MWIPLLICNDTFFDEQRYDRRAVAAATNNDAMVSRRVCIEWPKPAPEGCERDVLRTVIARS
jgi:hypothetical protein